MHLLDRKLSIKSITQLFTQASLFSVCFYPIVYFEGTNFRKIVDYLTKMFIYIF